MIFPWKAVTMPSYYRVRQVRHTLTLPNCYAVALHTFAASTFECRPHWCYIKPAMTHTNPFDFLRWTSLIWSYRCWRKWGCEEVEAGQCLLWWQVQWQLCGQDYSLIKKKVPVTGFMFRCPECHTKASLTTGTFFDKTHNKSLVSFTSGQVRPACGTWWIILVCRRRWWYSEYFRNVCTWKLSQ